MIYKASTRKPRLAFGNHEKITRAKIIKYSTVKNKLTMRIKTDDMLFYYRETALNAPKSLVAGASSPEEAETSYSLGEITKMPLLTRCVLPCMV